MTYPSASHMVILFKVAEGGSTVNMRYWQVCIPQFFPFCEAQQVLDEFRDRFIQEMDANAVVLDLLHYNIISEGDQRTITTNMDRTLQNKFLHFYLRKCTEHALMRVCDVISAMKGNPKMCALGDDMRRRLETGKPLCVCVCVCACACVCVLCVCVCALLY